MKHLIITFLIAFIWFPFCSKSNIPDAVKKVAKQGNGTTILSYAVSQTTPKGATHHGKEKLTNAELTAIDNGLTETFTNFTNEGFTETFAYSHFQIFTPPYTCLLSPVSKTPSFLVRADNYDGVCDEHGDTYDQYNTKGQCIPDGRGVIFASEKILDFGNRGRAAAMYVCPAKIQINVKHGSEHQTLATYPYDQTKYPKLAHNDGWRYVTCTLTHSLAILGHPLLPRNNRCSTDSFIDQDKQPVVNYITLTQELVHAKEKETGIKLEENEVAIQVDNIYIKAEK